MSRSFFLRAAAAALCSGGLFVTASLAADAPKTNAPAKTGDAKPADSAKPADTAKPGDVAKAGDAAKTEAADEPAEKPAKSADAKPAKKVPAFMDARKKREEALKQQFLAKYDKNGNGKLDPNERAQSMRDYAIRTAPRPTNTVRRVR